ncbi:MAG: DUF805 domain-containing protein [Sphingomicrobium sp.]|nr:DUF805 domain-containing protein [Sphingomonadales bacterium]
MTPIDWAMRPLRKYADFSGRAPRAEFWWFYLFYLIGYIIIGIIDSLIGTRIPTLLYVVAMFLPYLGVGVRRLHDTGRSGWWVLLPLIPAVIAGILAGPAILSGSLAAAGTAGIFGLLAVAAGIAVLVFFVLPGTAGANRFGPNPYEGGEQLRTV